MSHQKPLTAWQRAAALATEGACLLPYLLTALVSLIAQFRPPFLLPIIPAAWQPILLTAALALVYGAISAPLKLWRTAYYVRLCRVEDTLPSLRPTRRGGDAIGWRWRLWGRRAAALTLACAPSAMMFGYGSLISRQAATAAVWPVLWLAAGSVALLIGAVCAAVWQCRYALAPLYILRGCPAGAAMALSAKRMRRRIGLYVNFLGEEAPHLLLCLLIIPAVWIVPVFRRRRAALLLSLMPPDR